MSTSQALNDGGAAATPKKEKKPKDAKAEKKPKDATAEKTRDKKKKGKDKDKEKKPKLSDEEKAAAKEAKAAEKAAEKALKAEEKAAAKAAEKEAKAAEKAAAKEAKKAEKKAAAAAIVAYSQPGSDDIALASHAQRPAVPKLDDVGRCRGSVSGRRCRWMINDNISTCTKNNLTSGKNGRGQWVAEREER